MFLKLQRVAGSTLANARETRFRFVYLGTPVLRRRIRVLTNRTAVSKLSGQNSLSRSLNTSKRESCRFRFVSTRIGNAQSNADVGSTGVLEEELTKRKGKRSRDALPLRVPRHARAPPPNPRADEQNRTDRPPVDARLTLEVSTSKERVSSVRVRQHADRSKTC